MNRICFVVATKDRRDDLRRMLDSLALQTHLPDLVVIVDSSGVPVADVADEFRDRVSITYAHHMPPSASAQRNAGIKLVPGDIELIAFLDDDATLETDALENMLAFWASAPLDLGGAAFNMVNHPAQAVQWAKRLPLVESLGVYTNEPGRVTQSGWQTMICFVSEDLEVDWLPSGAAVWRSEILRSWHFDEYFNGYSYLEDLDFSYMVRRHWRLAVVADARYYHYPSHTRHAHQYGFGKTEVRNRFYFVAKHGLSYPKCWLGLLLRMGMNLCTLSRALGNCAGMAAELKSLLTGTLDEG
jgi:glycosyltransferase involved in cell wall biosynthesis